MTISTATTGEVWHVLRERDITLSGLVVTTVKVSVQQAVGQAGTDVGGSAASAAERLLSDPLGGHDWFTAVLAPLASMAATLDAWTFGLVGVLALLVLPVGGPVWAGMVPVGTTVAGVRRGVAWTRVRVSRNAPAAGITHHGRVPHTILIVDDSASFRELAQRVLEREGFTVVGTAASSVEALASVAALRPQVVLVDIHLGTDSGFDLARQLRPDDGREQPTVVLMSTHSAAELADLIDQSPAAGFVPKESLSGEAVRILLAGTV